MPTPGTLMSSANANHSATLSAAGASNSLSMASSVGKLYSTGGTVSKHGLNSMSSISNGSTTKSNKNDRKYAPYRLDGWSSSILLLLLLFFIILYYIIYRYFVHCSLPRLFCFIHFIVLSTKCTNFCPYRRPSNTHQPRKPFPNNKNKIQWKKNGINRKFSIYR